MAHRSVHESPIHTDDIVSSGVPLASLYGTAKTGRRKSTAGHTLGECAMGASKSQRPYPGREGPTMSAIGGIGTSIHQLGTHR